MHFIENMNLTSIYKFKYKIEMNEKERRNNIHYIKKNILNANSRV